MIGRPLVLFGALAIAPPALADDAADIEARLVEFEQAYNGGDAAAVAALYTEDAMALPPGGPIVEGRDGIEAMWQGAMEAGFKNLDLQPMEIEVVGDTAYETSTFAGAVGEDASPGKYVVVWKKVDGAWLLHRDIWNAMPAE